MHIPPKSISPVRPQITRGLQGGLLIRHPAGLNSTRRSMVDMSQQQALPSHGGSVNTNIGSQFGDTTYTKIFVGGLAWETQPETMRRHFEQYGDILEAVVITDKNTGRSKGYGFVTFRDPEAARRACVDATPVIDGRRANCNLASLGANRARSSFPLHGNRIRVMAPFPASPHSGGPTYVGSPAFPQPGQYTFQQGYPYPTYGYSPYFQDFAYQPNAYNLYSGPQFPQVYTGPGTIPATSLYPYMQFTQPLQAGPGYPTTQGYTVLPQLVQYGASSNLAAISTLPQQFGGLVPMPTPVSSTGVASPGPSSPQQIFTVPTPAMQQLPVAGIPEQPSAS